MKKILVLILSLFLLTTVNCVTTKQDVAETEDPAKEAAEVVAENFDLSGTWMLTEATKAPTCGGNKTVKSTVEITQAGDSATLVNKDQDYEWTGNIDKNMVLNPGSKSGKVEVYPYKLKVHGDANTLTGKVNWDWDNGTCDGYTDVTYKRK
jgi:hypothetical protein